LLKYFHILLTINNEIYQKLKLRLSLRSTNHSKVEINNKEEEKEDMGVNE
jgi:hypothetical protein